MSVIFYVMLSLATVHLGLGLAIPLATRNVIAGIKTLAPMDSTDANYPIHHDDETPEECELLIHAYHFMHIIQVNVLK